jgi:hypothetical protein
LIESVEKVIASLGAAATMPKQVAQPAASTAPTAGPALAISDDRATAGKKTSQELAINAIATKTTDPEEEARAIDSQNVTKGAKVKQAKRTGIEIYCEKPWSGLGGDPKCYITLPDSGFSLEKTLKWETHVFIALEPNKAYSLAIKRPSDLLSYKATINFSLAPGEVKRYRYESPAISFMSGEIKRDD